MTLTTKQYYNMQRPIKYWLNQLPDGYRELAILRNDPRFQTHVTSGVISVSQAINYLCHWTRTPEGHDFWYDVEQHYHHREDPDDNPYVQLPELPSRTRTPNRVTRNHE
jgi:hypothetical protein